MTDLYDLDASTRRIERAEQAVAAQQIYIARQTDPRVMTSARANLETLLNCLELARKNHTLIEEVVLRTEDECMAPTFDDVISKRML